MVGIALAVLSVLGLSSLGMHEKGLRAERQQEFIDVAKKISFDVKKKVDAFLLQEQSRPYTDYQYYYVPQASNQAAALVRSPLGNSISNGLAYGYFQLDNAGDVTTPYAPTLRRASMMIADYLDNLKQNLLPSLGNGETMQVRRIEPSEPQQEEYADTNKKLDVSRLFDSRQRSPVSSVSEQPVAGTSQPAFQKDVQEPLFKEPSKGAKKVDSKPKEDASRRSTYEIKSLEEGEQQTQVVSQSRANYELNTYNNEMLQQEPEPGQTDSTQQTSMGLENRPQGTQSGTMSAQMKEEDEAATQLDFAQQQKRFSLVRKFKSNCPMTLSRFVLSRLCRLPCRRPTVRKRFSPGRCFYSGIYRLKTSILSRDSGWMNQSC